MPNAGNAWDQMSIFAHRKVRQQRTPNYFGPRRIGQTIEPVTWVPLPETCFLRPSRAGSPTQLTMEE